MEQQSNFNRSGKRYRCAECGEEVIVVLAGHDQGGPLTCHGQPMILQPPPHPNRESLPAPVMFGVDD